jgi:hypothetical protein
MKKAGATGTDPIGGYDGGLAAEAGYTTSFFEVLERQLLF